MELLAALSLVGFALLGGILLVGQIADGSRRIRQDGAGAAREGNGERLLTKLLLNASSSPDTARGLRGDSLSVGFWSFCDVPGGWTEGCHVRLAIDTQGDSSVLLAVFESGEALSVRREVQPIRLQYYDASGRDSSWRAEWKSNLTLPTAVAVRVGNDTVIYLVGGSPE